MGLESLDFVIYKKWISKANNKLSVEGSILNLIDRNMLSTIPRNNTKSSISFYSRTPPKSTKPPTKSKLWIHSSLSLSLSPSLPLMVKHKKSK